MDQDGFVRVVNNKAKRQQQQQQQQQIHQQQHTSLKKKSAKKEQLPNPTQRQPIDFINPQTSADANSDDDATIKNDEDEPNIIRSVSVDYSVKSDTQRCVQRASLPSTPLKVRIS